MGLPCASRDVEDAFRESRRTRDVDLERPPDPGEVARRCREGRISFFCLDAGKISSRSTGTPRDTRKRRRVRDRIQSGGANGGGATSWDHSEAERGVRNRDDSLGRVSGAGRSSSSGGKRLFRHCSVADRTSSGASPSKSGMG